MSADIPDFGAVRRDLAALSPGFSNGGVSAINARIARLGMSPRQQELNRLWSHYTCNHYDMYRLDWNGQQVESPLDLEAVVSSNSIPPGFNDMGASTPLKYRRPNVRYNIVRTVVNRFSSLLFSQKRHPTLRVDGDSLTEDYATALAETARLWPKFMQARAFGGACGTVIAGFQFLDGKPLVEVHDPRWTTPKFKNRSQLSLEAVEELYQFPKDEWNLRDQRWETVFYWYRRVITDREDLLYKPERVTDEQPVWQVERAVTHGFGFCPVVWIQNLPVEGDIDGEGDCHGLHDLAREIDELMSEASKGTKANCDPTTVIVSPDKMADIRKGSDHALKLTQGTADYMEISGSGPKSASDLAKDLKQAFLEQANCILDDVNDDPKTATEVLKRWETMLSKADVMREQYGEYGIKPLMNMMVEASRKLTSQKITTADGQPAKIVVKLPPRFNKDENGGTVRVERQLGDVEGAEVKLGWPPYYESTLADAQAAVAAAAGAEAAQLIDKEHAVKFAAPYLKVEDVPSMVKKVEEAKQKDQDALSAQLGLGDNTGWGSQKPLGERMPKLTPPGGGAPKPP